VLLLSNSYSGLECNSFGLLMGCVARIWYEEAHETKRKYFKDDTQKYSGIHAINNDKTIGLYILTG